MNKEEYQQLAESSWESESLIQFENYFTLSDIIQFLEKKDPKKELAFGITNPHSYRGYYEDLAFEVKEGTSTVDEWLKVLRPCIGQTFEGYKGGNYKMTDTTDCWFSEYGSGGGEKIGELFLRVLLGEL